MLIGGWGELGRIAHVHVIVVIKSTGELDWSVAKKDLICDLMDIKMLRIG